MPIYTEEVLGPVASVYRADDIDHAIEIANTPPSGSDPMRGRPPTPR
jgi:succinate-semialdehyde dehydrogenase / glutarate-semialdehyde dehydrogenase